MEDAQATAKWANRVLRPLTSICRRIAKHQETLSMIATESKPQDTTEGSDVRASGTDHKQESRHNCSGSDADPDENDPAWIPGKKPERRRPRHKYSSKAEETGGKKRNRLSMRSPEAPRTLPGAIEVATPLITGRRWEMPPECTPQVFRDRYSLHKSPWQELLDQSGDSGFADIAHNLDRVFQNFLSNTMISKQEVKPSSEGSRRGARSLLSMVARSLPEFIASEQEAQDELDEDGDEDMCDAYFTELEAFYAPYGTGWKPLREAVRAQGIYLVSTLIQNRWITDSIACALIEKCRSFAPEESDSLLSTLLSTRKNYPYPQALRPVVEHDPSDPIRLLRKYAHHGVANRSYIFDELAKLLLRGVLPPEWMGTKLWTSWMTRATISLSKEDQDCPAATRLIEAVILSASDARPVTAAQRPTLKPAVKGKTVPRRATRTASTTTWEISNLARPCPLQVEDALSNHVISLMAALCGMHISRSRAFDDTDCVAETKARYITSYLHIALQRELESSSAPQRAGNTPHQLLRRGCILLATSLVQCNDKILLDNNHYVMASTASVDECAEIIASHSDIVRELALFVHQAFRCLSKTAEDETERTGGEIRDMVSQLARLADTSALSALLGRVAAEAAMEFAEATADPDDHMWAIDVQQAAVAKQRQEGTAQRSLEEPEQSSQSTGLFRWEDSIGEWVACTPATKGKPIIVQKAQRPMRMLSSPVPCIASSTDTDSSSPGSDRFDDSVSSLTSSPVPTATKRTFEDAEPPNTASYPTRYNSTVEPVTRRGILRERSANLTRRMTPAAQQARKVEVVIINHKESSPRQPIVRPTLERAAKQVHRTVERRRSTCPSVSTMRPIVEPPRARQTVIPCYQDDDSDDELSFL
ncbi:hypothetical protein N7519_002646 [Penicillium mononematosum]|uniref:uncharacterized protein n=1 Tax=Penicillium mononematosum TaxID=268346 RepID=UPI0025491E57|nr:uncharacterized protein N7519_002646 [Penicillium mononematosum]KAJ6187738.1 hypothetical protein N7519_002646 [Penicillium mononematosum]